MQLDDRLRKLAEANGADFFGVADLTPAHEAILAQGGPGIASYPRAISIGIRLLDTIVDQLPAIDRGAAVSYKKHCYDVVNERLDQITFRMASILQREGCRAYPVPSSERSDDERICAVFSNKMAAHLAGLGWIGKSCLLVTPAAGPRVRWATVLTDAPFEAGTPMGQKCGSCRKCVDVCPQHAFTGRNFVESEPREARYDARKCETYLKSLEKSTGYGVCGLCLYVCPHGKKNISQGRP
jgi:epoxyqueuosine reductase QueG